MQQETTTQLEIKSATNLVETHAPIEHQAVTFSSAYLSLLGSALLAACGGSEDGDDTKTTQSDTASTNQADARDSISGETGVTNGYRPSGSNTTSTVHSAAGFNNFPIAYTTNDAARFLLQSQFNASDAEIAAVRTSTFAMYLQQQFEKPIGQTGWQWLEALAL